MRAWMLMAGMAAAAVAQPATAAVQLVRANMQFYDIIAGPAFPSPLGLGVSSDSFGYYDYSACDGDESRCEGLPYGGRRASGSWTVDLADNGFDHRFQLFHGTDIGGPLQNEFFLEAFFISDRPVRISITGASGFTDFGCFVGCSRYSDFGGGSLQLDDGRWETTISALMGAAVLVGGYEMFQEGRVQLTEVPEPESWAMLIAGFGLIGAVSRRRRHCAV
jgi:hypothetical protein